jgi:UDP-N-acetylmuramoylalanine--D-glutamate ligase
MRYTGQQIAVLGLGESGEAAARLLARGGAAVTMLDSGDPAKLATRTAVLAKDGMRCVTGSAALAVDAAQFAFAVLSPGIDPAVQLVRNFADKKTRVIGELELAFQNCACPVVAISGSNGKTTTTGLTAAMLNACGLRTFAAGNISPAFSAVVRESAACGVMTLEVSSFQLEAIETFRPRVAVYLNLSANHLDRYPSMTEYRTAKLRLFENQTAEDFAVVNFCEKLPPLKAQVTTFSAYKSGGDFDLRGNVIHFRGVPVFDMKEARLKGQHNAENVMAALAVGHCLGLDFSAMAAPVREFSAPAHRCELVRTLDGVDWVNDSKCTSLDAMQKALLAEERPVVLIAGGKDKGFEFDSVAQLVAARCHYAVLIGEMAARIGKSWSGGVPCARATSLADAVNAARAKARSGDMVLFSPGTSSFDMFKNYIDRGDQFRALVQSLQPNQP